MRPSTGNPARSHRLLACLPALLLAGCAAIKPEPFEKFSASLQELREGADAALAYLEDWNEARFYSNTLSALESEGGEEVVLGLLIGPVEDNPYGWTMERAPLFLATKKFRSGVSALNGTLAEYAALLKELAGSDLVSIERFDAMAGELNANLASAAGALDFQGGGEGIAVFSTAATAAARAFIENRRQGMLLEVLEENQANMEKVAERLRRAMGIAARNLRHNYEERSMEMARALAPEAGGGGGRRDRLEDLMNLNREFVARLAVLEALDRAYGTLPEAHRELTAAVERPGMTLSYIRGLYGEGKHLYRLYKEMTDAD